MKTGAEKWEAAGSVPMDQMGVMGFAQGLFGSKYLSGITLMNYLLFPAYQAHRPWYIHYANTTAVLAVLIASLKSASNM